jgi:hypothetical protein
VSELRLTYLDHCPTGDGWLFIYPLLPNLAYCLLRRRSFTVVVKKSYADLKKTFCRGCPDAPSTTPYLHRNSIG